MKLELLTESPSSGARPVPLLFVHGMSHAAWCWAEHFLPYFSRHGYAAHALSLRGHGGSEGRERLRWTALAEFVADVAQVVTRLERPPVLVGHSMGGLIVQKFLESHAVPAAVLLASVPPSGVFHATLRIAHRHPLAFMKAGITMSMQPVFSDPDLAREFLFSPGMSREQVMAYAAQLQDESYRAYWDMMGTDLSHPDRVKTPLLVLGAGDDRLIAPDEIEATARAFNTRASLFPGMAHDMMLDSGWRAVADRILDWLAAQDL